VGGIRSRFRSNKLLLVLAGAVVPKFVRFKTVYEVGNEISSSARGGIYLYEWASNLLHRNFARVYVYALSQRRSKGICTYGHYTRFSTLLQWSILVQDIHTTSVYADFYSRLYLILFYHSKWQLVTWTVVGLTTTKFKILILSMHDHLFV
jgi:hypothetical protein